MGFNISSHLKDSGVNISTFGYFPIIWVFEEGDGLLDFIRAGNSFINRVNIQTLSPIGEPCTIESVYSGHQNQNLLGYFLIYGLTLVYYEKSQLQFVLNSE